MSCNHAFLLCMLYVMPILHSMIYSHKISYYVNLKNYEAPLYTIFSTHSLLLSSLHLVLKHIQFSVYSVTSLSHINYFSIILIFRV